MENSRASYGESISQELQKKTETAEEVLRSLGLKQCRVRVHGETLARIEVLPEDIEHVIREVSRRVINERFRELGFTYVTVDLGGYKTGGVNEVLK